jgi:hypothetical protein
MRRGPSKRIIEVLSTDSGHKELCFLSERIELVLFELAYFHIF